MPYQFDPNKYRKTFDNMFGPGSYQSGLSRARDIGRSKAQVEFAKSAWEERQKQKEEEAKKKTYSDAVEFWKRNRKTILDGGGAYRVAENIKNDPGLKQAIKDEGYNVEDYIDAIYAGVSDGKWRSEREYNQYNERLEKEAKERANNPLYGLSKEKPKKEEKKQSNGNILTDFAGHLKNLYHFANPFDDVTIEDLRRQKQSGNMKPSNQTEELMRFLTRSQNSASFGLSEQIEKDSGMSTGVFSDRTGKGKIADTVADLTGYILPGAAAAKASRGVLGGLSGLSKLNKYGRAGILGAAEGATIAGAEVGTRELINPDDYTAKQNLAKIGIEGLAGAVIDPAIVRIGQSKLLQRFFKKNAVTEKELKEALDNPIVAQEVKQEILALPEGQKLLPAPRMKSEWSYQSPKPVDVPKGLALPPGRNYIPARRTNNYYADRLNELVTEAKKLDLPPGREWEAVQDLWSRMATREDPSLDELIRLGSPSLQNYNPLDLLQRAKQSQRKSVYGIDNILNIAKTKPVPTVNEGTPLPFKREIMNIKRETEPINYVGRIEPMNATRVKRVEPNVNFDSLNFGDRIAIRKGRTTTQAEFVTKNGDYVVIRQRGKERVIPASDVFEKLNTPKNTKQAFENIKKEPELKESKKVETKNVVEKVQRAEKLEPEEWETLLSNSDNWKDLKPFFYARDTIERNFEKTMGKDAPLFKELFVEPTKKSEANRIRFKQKLNENIKTFNIKPGSKDDQLVQMFGEKKITLDELKKQTKNWKEVQRATEHFRNVYDDLLNQINDILTKFGYDPIPKRKDYFPHYTSDSNIVKDMLGYEKDVTKLPVDINGLTDEFLPRKRFFANALRRKGDETSFGAMEGFDRYLEGASNIIYHTPNISRFRDFDKAIRSRYGVTNSGSEHLSNFVANLTEYTNKLAGKQSRIDRGVESIFGRNALNMYKALQKNTGANMTGANISSALTGFIPTTQAAAQTKKPALVKGMLETIRNVIQDDGFIKESDFLTKRIGVDPLFRTKWQTVRDKSFWLMRTIDSFNAQTIVRGKYNELIEKGLSHKEALKQADSFAERIMAGRSIESMPTLFQSKTLGPITQFQLEVNNQLSHLIRDIPKSVDYKKMGMLSAYGQIAVYGWAYNQLYEQLTGRRAALDPINIAEEVYKKSKDGDYAGALREGIEITLGQLPMTSFFVEGRVPISASLPSIKEVIDGDSEDLKKQAGKVATTLIPPAGGLQAKKIYQGLEIFANDKPVKGVYGKYRGDEVLRYPVEDSLPNRLRGVLFGKYALPESQRYYDEELRDLGPKQTRQVLSSSNPMQEYNQIINQRKAENLMEQLKKISSDRELTKKEKDKLTKKLINDLQKLK